MVREWKDDETEQELARKTYETIADRADRIPDGTPDDFGDVEAAVVVAVDENERIHTIAAGIEEHQSLLSSAVHVVQDVLYRIQRWHRKD